MSENPLPRDLFPVTKNYAYFNHAAVGVLPLPTAQAIHEFIEAHSNEGVVGTARYEARLPEFRERIGRFIGARGAEIALLRSTSDGANVIASGLGWNEGDEIILPRSEFGSNFQAWLRLRKRGVKLDFVPDEERLTPDALRNRITKRTKVVSVSWVSFDDGYRHDLAALAEVAHSHGAMLCVDAIQALGAFPVDVKACGIDALYCGGAKWMLSLQGVSFLYLDSKWLDRLELASPGWRSVEDMWDFHNYEQPYVANASRFEGGTPNFVGALSLATSSAVLEQAGTQRIAQHVLDLTDRLVDGLHEIGAQVASLRGPSESSGIVRFMLPDTDPVELGKNLGREGIVTTYRANGIRVSPHGYNKEEEIDRLTDALRSYQCSPSYSPQ